MPPGLFGGGDDGTPEEELDYRERLEQVVEEKRRALADPGPPWREWFLFNGVKWWVGLGFLIIDTWFIVGGLESNGLLALALALLIPVTYLQLLLWRVLWYRPNLDRPARGDYHRTWLRPVEFGRWTPEGELIRTKGRAALGPQGPNPRDFV
jgi:hypothetical protein